MLLNVSTTVEINVLITSHVAAFREATLERILKRPRLTSSTTDVHNESEREDGSFLLLISSITICILFLVFAKNKSDEELESHWCKHWLKHLLLLE